jgi:hypothetical protein
MKDLRQTAGQRVKARLQQDAAHVVDRLERAPLVDGVRRRLRDGEGRLGIPGTAAATGEGGILARPPVSASRLTETTAAGTRGSTRRRWLAAVRTWATAGQLGPDRDRIVGRHIGARC